MCVYRRENVSAYKVYGCGYPLYLGYNTMFKNLCNLISLKALNIRTWHETVVLALQIEKFLVVAHHFSWYILKLQAAACLWSFRCEINGLIFAPWGAFLCHRQAKGLNVIYLMSSRWKTVIYLKIEDAVFDMLSRSELRKLEWAGTLRMRKKGKELVSITGTPISNLGACITQKREFPDAYAVLRLFLKVEGYDYRQTLLLTCSIE